MSERRLAIGRRNRARPVRGHPQRPNRRAPRPLARLRSGPQGHSPSPNGRNGIEGEGEKAEHERFFEGFLLNFGLKIQIRKRSFEFLFWSLMLYLRFQPSLSPPGANEASTRPSPPFFQTPLDRRRRPRRPCSPPASYEWWRFTRTERAMVALATKAAWLLAAVLVTTLPFGAEAKKGRGSKWWALAKAGEPNNFMDNSIRGTPFKKAVVDDNVHLPFLTRKQKRLVKENAGSLVVLAKAAQDAIAECQFQFVNRRWNCNTVEHMRGRSVFGKIADRGCRETAFIYAITSAAVVHAMARACSENTLESCSCDYRNLGPNGAGWEWGGCSDNIRFGRSFSKEFVDSHEKGRDFRHVMNLHNNEAGRSHVESEMRRECKCHGMSGSCTVKTCWMRLPSFRIVGDKLKESFDGASRVLVNNNGNTRPRRLHRPALKPYNPELKSPTQRDLVYYEESPDFCRRDPKTGSIGTHGRQCNATSLGIDGCDLMCCSRGHQTEEQEVIERCRCTFHWCCEVKCDVCHTKKTVHKCN